MAAWKAFPGMALGSMIEVFSHRSPWCSALGHQPVWKTDQLACGRSGCRQTFPQATAVLLREFTSPEGLALIALEVKHMHVEGQTTSDEPGEWE
jgi:predicted NBD/HSP70 family sugar kinase